MSAVARTRSAKGWIIALLAFGVAGGTACRSYPSLGWHEWEPPENAAGADAREPPDAEPPPNPPHGGAGNHAAPSGTAGAAHGGAAGNAPAGSPAVVDASIPPLSDDAGTTDDPGADPIECRTGMYTGWFTCTVEATNLEPTAIQLEFTLTRASPDAREATSSSRIFFNTLGGTMSAELATRLDCATGVFNANITNGLAILAPVPVSVPFVGTMNGKIDETVGTLSGTWSLTSTAGSTFGGCVGTWSAPLPPLP